MVTIDSVSALIAARGGPVFISSPEEDRVMARIVALSGSRNIIRWDLATGFSKRLTPEEQAKQLAELQKANPAIKELTPDRLWVPLHKPEEVITLPDTALASLADIYPKHINKVDGKQLPPIFVFFDMHHFLSGQQANATVMRWLRVAYQKLMVGNVGMVFLSPSWQLPEDIDKFVIRLPVSTPSREEVTSRVESWIKMLSLNTIHLPYVEKYLKSPTLMEALINACMGLTDHEIKVCLNIAVVSKAQDLVAAIQAEKCKIITQSGLMDFFPAGSISDVGGLAVLKKWLSERKDAFSKEAQEYGLDAPKGLLLLGVQGAGKSLTAKAIAGLLGMSLVKLDIGRMMGGIVGQTEANIRRALDLVERVSPAVLWIDEIEKGLSGSGSSDKTDGGTTARLMQTLLTWMNDKQAPVMVVATANSIDNLPPELMRKGRFDEIFFVDLPAHKERVDILKIHISKKKRNPVNFDLNQIADFTNGFSGAELEQLVKAALIRSFSNKRELETQDLVECAKATKPLSVTSAKKINDIRAFGKQFAVSASEPDELPTTEVVSAEDLPIDLGDSMPM